MKRIVSIFFMLLLAGSVFSQKKELIEDKDLIHERAIAELDLAMTPPEGSIYLFAQENAIKGEYTFDISIRDKGTVSSIFAVGNNNGTIDSQNRLKDFLMTVKFNFKAPKGKFYKFRYTFGFE